MLIGVIAGDSSGFRRERKRMDRLEGEVTSDDTSKMVAPLVLGVIERGLKIPGDPDDTV